MVVSRALFLDELTESVFTGRENTTSDPFTAYYTRVAASKITPRKRLICYYTPTPPQPPSNPDPFDKFYPLDTAGIGVGGCRNHRTEGYRNVISRLSLATSPSPLVVRNSGFSSISNTTTTAVAERYRAGIVMATR